ncbi:class I SAM-dependent methyltransferase [Sorangium sp. So ce185]|uniref:class I SAM-dependent methyltransferase n=1 Tax=Sorangium sp. So ce185 TaxID=3133287 RepID=UPI003F5FD6AC
MIPDAYFGRFETAKYRKAGALKRKLIQRFVSSIHELFIEANPVQRVLEIGVGEGFLSGYLSEKFPEKQFTGVDLNPADIERLQRLFPSIQARVGSAYDLSDLPSGFDLVICAEVLEHLETPDRALAEIQRLACRRVILSVPYEPFFMLSNLLAGNNVRRFGNDVEHINHWSPASFRRLIEPRFDVVRMTTSYPWVLCLAAPR